MSSGRRKQSKQRVPLDLFLSGMMGGSLGEKDHPVIVVDEKKRRSFPRHRTSESTYRSHSNSSFCSSVTSCSLESSSAAAAASSVLCSRWDSMPSSQRNQDTKLRAPTRVDKLKLPSRTRTNDLNLKKTPSRKTMLPKRSIRRHRSLRSTSSAKSKEQRTAKLHASI